MAKFDQKKAMKKQVVIYQLVLDRSGSMGSVTEETISGFNEQVQRIHELAEQYPNQQICVNLCLFNHQVVQALKNVSAGNLQELSFNSYRPEGMTALYDAVGLSIRQVKKQIKMLADEARYKVYFVILTDGHENASREFRYEKIKKSIGYSTKHTVKEGVEEIFEELSSKRLTDAIETKTVEWYKKLLSDKNLAKNYLVNDTIL